jgi:small conductance mechanosensitive channel
MSATPTLLIPWYWRWVQRLQGVIDTRPKQYLATLAIPVGFVGAVFLIYLGGKPLKRRFTSELVEIARTLTIMGVALVDAVLFVIIWRRFGDAITELDSFGSRLVPGTQTAVNLYIGFIALLGTYMLTRVTKRVIRYWSEGGRISPHQRELSHHLVQMSLFFVAALFIFGLFGLDPADLFLGAGVLGVVLGLAARKTLANVLSGMIILFGRPFEAGDWITVGEQEGIVTDITVFNTQVRTFNEEHLLIPNDLITDKEVINYSKTERLRLITEVGIDYDDDISEAATIAKRTMESCEAVADSPNPDVVLESFGDSSVVLRLRYWIDRPTIQRKLSAQNEVIEAVKAAFEAEDIRIPFPQRELMGRSETDGLKVSTSGDGSVDGRVERAVRPASTGGTDTSTAVREPVEDEYGGDGDPDGDEDDTDDGDGEADDDLESAAQLVEDGEADVSSPHPRREGSEVYPATEDDTLTEPVEDEHGKRSRPGVESDDQSGASESDDSEDDGEPNS